MSEGSKDSENIKSVNFMSVMVLLLLWIGVTLYVGSGILLVLVVKLILCPSSCMSLCQTYDIGQYVMEVQEHREDQTVEYSMVVHNDKGIKAQDSTRYDPGLRSWKLLYHPAGLVNDKFSWTYDVMTYMLYYLFYMGSTVLVVRQFVFMDWKWELKSGFVITSNFGCILTS